MAAVTMYIEKFGKEVTIDEDHPLAIAQRERNAKPSSRGSSSADADKPQAPNLSKLNAAKLHALCEERGIEVPEGSSKKEMVALLEAGAKG